LALGLGSWSWLLVLALGLGSWSWLLVLALGLGLGLGSWSWLLVLALVDTNEYNALGLGLGGYYSKHYFLMFTKTFMEILKVDITHNYPMSCGHGYSGMHTIHAGSLVAR
jgi:hypothetical protein